MSTHYIGGFAVTPSDSADLSPTPNSLWIGTTGNVSLVMRDGSTITLQGVPVGELRVRARRVRATGTTASNIVALV